VGEVNSAGVSLERFWRIDAKVTSDTAYHRSRFFHSRAGKVEYNWLAHFTTNKLTKAAN